MKVMIFAVAMILAPAALAQDNSGDYVNIGEYKGDLVGVAPAPIATYEVITVPLLPTAPVAASPEAYAAPLPYTDMSIQAMPVEASSYQPPLDTGTVVDFGAGFADLTDPEYERDRLAAYDTNGDGRISSGEAAAGMTPLTR